MATPVDFDVAHVEDRLVCSQEENVVAIQGFRRCLKLLMKVAGPLPRCTHVAACAEPQLTLMAAIKSSIEYNPGGCFMIKRVASIAPLANACLLWALWLISNCSPSPMNNTE